MRADSQEPIKSLRQLAQAESDCTRCPLYRKATQAAAGEGPNRVAFMLVGEQPGDKEDLAGKPFVAPAGRILDQALDLEHSLVKPSAMVALGATGARRLTGRAVTIGKMRGKPMEKNDGTRLVTIHPVLTLAHRG